MSETDLDLSCAFLENELAKLRHVYGDGGILLKGKVEISPSPEPLFGDPQDIGEKDE